MSSRSLRRLALAAVPLSILISRIALADDAPTTAQLNAARALFIAAEKDEDAQRWSDAFEKLQRVAQVKLTPGVRYHLALCEEHLGRLVAALGDYKTAASDALVEKASDVLRLVDKRVTDTTERIPHVIVVLVPSPGDATVLLDGIPVASGVPVSTDPGTHTIDARAPGCTPATTSVSLQERDAARVELRLEPAPPPPAAPPAVATPMSEPPPAAPENPAASRDRTLALLATAGAVGLGVGGVGAFLAASGEHTDSVQACARIVSTEADACDSRKNTVRAWDWVAVTAWAGAAAAGTIAVVSWVHLRHDAGDTSGSTGSPSSSPSARVIVGPASIGFEGAF